MHNQKLHGEKLTQIRWDVPHWAAEIIDDLARYTELTTYQEMITGALQVATEWTTARVSRKRIIYHSAEESYEITEAEFLEKEGQMLSANNQEVCVAIPDELLAQLLVGTEGSSGPKIGTLADEEEEEQELSIEFCEEGNSSSTMVLSFNDSSLSALRRLMIEEQLSSPEALLNRAIFRMGEILLANLNEANLGVLEGSTLEAWALPLLNGAVTEHRQTMAELNLSAS